MFFIPSMLFETINDNNALCIFPNRSGKVFLANDSFDPTRFGHWKKSVEYIQKYGINPVGKITYYHNQNKIQGIVYKKWEDLDNIMINKIEKIIEKMIRKKFNLNIKGQHPLNIKAFLFHED